MNNLVKFGNSKLPKQTMVFNIGTATDCPSRKLGLCKVDSSCYALQAEKQYKNVLPYRKRQAEFWNSSNAYEIVNYFKMVMINNPRLMQVRFNESGDFHSQYDVNKMYEVATILFDELGVRSYVYTARKDLKFEKGHRALTVNGSGFMVDNEFTVRPLGESIDANQFDAKCKGDCKQCSLCIHSHGLKIMVEPHGTHKHKLSKKLKAIIK